MRILGYIEHPTLKITIFKNDDKLSVKFENMMYEQTYKFRSALNLESADDIRQVIDAQYIAQVEQDLTRMHQTQMTALMRRETVDENEFDEIL